MRTIFEIIAENSKSKFATVFTLFLIGVNTTKDDVGTAEFCGLA